MNPLEKLNHFGQSVWYDNIERDMLSDDGQIAHMIQEDDLRGVTSNPAIYEKAIAHSKAYDVDIKKMADEYDDARDIFFELVIEDIQRACNLFLPVYEKTQGEDGFVSLEVSPDLAFDVLGTIKEAKKLWGKINRKNAMIKIPATIEGIEAMQFLIAEGININMTLIFSVKRYIRVVEAYIAGLEKRLKTGQRIDRVASVASFFISRIDAVIDPLLKDKQPDLQAKVAIANAKNAYQIFLQYFNNDRFVELQKHGAKFQRLLWASTGVKNEDYSDVMYVESLMGEDTVNTMPPVTYAAFKDHGHVGMTILQDLDESSNIDVDLASVNISLDEITRELEKNGIQQFQDAFTAMIDTINDKLTTL